MEASYPCLGLDYLFYSDDAEDQDIAKGLCQACPNISACREAGYNESYGVWGGLTSKERWENHPNRLGIVPPCGTESAYYRHRRMYDEEPCGPCKAAYSSAQKSRSKLARGVSPNEGTPSGQTPIEHGTQKGYRQELKRGLETCDACRLAHNEHQKNYGRAKSCKTCGELTVNVEYCSLACRSLPTRKVTRPSKNELKSKLESMSYSAIARELGVSRSAVRKWASSYGLTDAKV